MSSILIKSIKSLIKFIIFFLKIKNLCQLVKVSHQLKYKFINKIIILLLNFLILQESYFYI
jgi:hypothetical protein